MENDSFSPKSLSTAVEGLGVLLKGINFSEITPGRLQRVREKLLRHGTLQADEILILFRYANELNNFELILFEEQVLAALKGNIDGLDTLAQEAFKIFSPAKAVDVALKTKLFDLIDTRPAFLKAFSGNSLTDLVHDLTVNGTIIKDINVMHGCDVRAAGLFGMVDLFTENQSSSQILSSNISQFVDLLKKLECPQKQILDYLERISSTAMKTDPNWITKLLSPETMLGFIVNWIRVKRVSLGIEHGNLKTLIKEFELLNDLLADLEQAVPDRGKFWRLNLPKAEKILPRRFGRIVGVAMYFNSHVIIEFGPSGIAAYIYRKEVFDSQVKDHASWQMSSIVDQNIRIRGSQPGKIHHIPNVWQMETDDLLFALLRK